MDIKKTEERQQDFDDEVQALFIRYLEICNQVLSLHHSKPPFQDIFSTDKQDLHERPFDLAIYDDRSKGAYTLQLQNRRLELVGEPKNVEAAWRMNISDLEHIVDHAVYYIQHPELLRLEWLKSRFEQ